MTKRKKNFCYYAINKNVSNNRTIDLYAYAVKSNVETSLNGMNSTLSTKQNNSTFSNPSNTISLKYNSAQFNLDSLGNLNLMSGTSSQ